MSHLTVSLVLLSGKRKPGHPEREPADGPPPGGGAAAHPDCEGNVSTKVHLTPVNDMLLGFSEGVVRGKIMILGWYFNQLDKEF